MLAQDPIQNHMLHVVVVSLDSFHLEQFQVGVYMYLVNVSLFHCTLNPMRAGAGPILPCTVPGPELTPRIQKNK